MPREFSRSRRVEEAIQRALSEALAGKVRDPRLAGVSITGVKVSRDLSVARVHYALLSGSAVTPEIEAAFQAAAGFLRSYLAGELRVRSVPELRFSPDLALMKGRALESLIDSAMRTERRASPDDEEPPPGDPGG